MKKSMRIGIDFGSTYSVFSEYNAEKDLPEALTTDTAAPPSVPSVVCINIDDGTELAGLYAKSNMGEEEYAVFEAFKMLLIENNRESLAQFGYKGEYTPKKIATIFLRNTLENIRQRYLTSDGRFEMVYICVPEIWCSETRNLGALDGKALLREILLKDSGLPIKDVRVVTEPEAASAFFAWNYERKTKKAFNGHLLLIDYGGGTLDLTLTEVSYARGGTMEIASRARGGAGENHRDARGKMSVGSAGLQYMRTVLCYAIADSADFGAGFVPDIAGNDFAKAFKKLEDTFKNFGAQKKIRAAFESFGNYRKNKGILDSPSESLTSFRFKGKSIIVTLQHVYRAYRDTIERVVETELEKINAEIRSRLQINPCAKATRNNDNFKIALVGGFSSFYLVRQQVSEIYNLYDESIDDSIINTDDRELAISLGASLFAAGKVTLQKTARFSIGIVSKQTDGQLMVRYGIKCQSVLTENPCFMLFDETKPDIISNRQSFGGVNNNISCFVIEKTERLDHGCLLLIKDELRRRLNRLPEEGIWHIGFSIDEHDIISIHFEDHYGIIPTIRIPLDSYGNLFELSDVVDITRDRRTGNWVTSRELKI